MQEIEPNAGRKVRRVATSALIQKITGFLSLRIPLGRVGVAVSGGSDSMALLHLLAELAPAQEMALTVLHFNHGLRGGESDGDEAFVRDQAEALELPFVCGRADGANAAPNSNVEAWAREQRLAFFQRERTRLSMNWIATGHTRDDQAETVLMRILRGTGSTGLAGVLPETREGLVRPLLGCTRKELRSWLSAHGITWREDRTNAEPGFADRNRVRLELLPKLRADWNPQLDQVLAHLAEVAQAEEEYWAEEVSGMLPQLNAGSMIFEVSDFRRLPLAMRRRMIRGAIARTKGDLRRIEFLHVEQALGLFDRATGNGRARLPGGLLVERSFGQVRLALDAPPAPAEVTWGVVDRNSAGMGAYNRSAYYLDVSKVTLPLALRSWQAGEVFRPVGSNGPKRMKDLFQASRVPFWERAGWPMLVSGGAAVWTRGFGVAAGLEATPGATIVVKIEDFGKPERKLESNFGLPASIV